MTALEFGLALNNIALALNEEEYAKVKPYTDKLEQGIVELLDENKRLEDRLNAK